jgi:release factor glutamine methyltransferase
MSQTIQQWLDASELERIDAYSLMQHTLMLTRVQLIMHNKRELTDAEQKRLALLSERRAAGEPLAYVTGRREFYSLSFEVTPAVLIPRADTELLVDTALALLEARPNQRVLDMGTGSGCIAISIAVNAPRAMVTALDASADSLHIAERNMRRICSAPIRLLRSNWFEAVHGERFDLIVSNPPYIAEHDTHLAALSHEPQQALTSGADGLADLRHLIANAGAHLNPGGALWLEHGYDQAAAVRELLVNAGFQAVESKRDLAGIERISGGLAAAARLPQN